MRTILKLIGLAVAIAVGYWVYESLSTARDVPGKVVKDVVEFTKDAVRIVSGEGTKHGQDKGGSCTVGPDCKGYRGPGQSGNACCKGTCTTLVKDYAGVYFCPAECKSGPIAKPGSC